ncbi:MAG: substrate-binding domain-containing protein [Chloroflexota bacterium]|nr:substrate-binding domain-containing protein [Chloroflexota bacterium]MDE2897118.1 substrate-binding domain-containing protein [Chloroflexota bacterium]
MAHIGVFYCEGFDPGAYTVALYHAQLEAARGGHGLSIHQFTAGSLADAAERAPEVDGLLAFATGEADLEFLRGHLRPSVVCERIAPGCAYVAPDNFDIGRTAAQHLLDLGHQRLAVVLPGDPANLDSYHGSRFAGIRDTAAAAGHPLNDSDIYFGEKVGTTGQAAVEAMLARGDLPDAIYVQNMPMALAALRTLAEAGVAVPDDVSLLGTTFVQLNAPAASEHSTPPMTAVTFEKEEMGRQGVEYLAAAAEGRTSELLEVRLPGVLVSGASTARAAVAVAG